jgi:hypothetical protein
VQWLFWEGSFDFEERTIHGSEAQAAELERFVQATRPYGPAVLRASDAARAASRLIRGASHRARGIFGGGSLLSRASRDERRRGEGEKGK